MKYLLLAAILMGFGVNLVANNMQYCCGDSRIQIGGSYSYVNVKPEGDASEHGNMGGAQGIYEYRPINWLYAAVSFGWREGTTHGGMTRSINEYDVAERIGYTFATCDDVWRFSLYTGFGYRYLGEEVNSIKFKYNDFYVPVGFLLEGQMSCNTRMGLNFQWMPQVYTTVSIVPLQGARWDTDNELGNFLIELPITFQAGNGNGFSFMIVPFVETWHDGRTTASSSSGLTLNVPEIQYLFAGAKINFGYRF